MSKISRRNLLKILGLGSAITVTGSAAKAQTSGGLTLVTFLHTNDTHDHLEPTVVTGTGADGKAFSVQYGGVARVKTLIDDLKRRSINPVILDAGDVFTGTLYGQVYKGLADLAYMEAFGTQAQTIGNHEFDNGPGQLADYIKNASFPVVSANIDASGDEKLKGLIKPYTILDTDNGPLGVIGVTTPDTPITSSPGDTVKFLDPYTTVQKAADDLRAQGIKNIVLLSHLGYNIDLELAPRLKGVGVIIGGHTHTPLGKYEGLGLPKSEGPYPTVLQDAAGNTILVVQAWEWAKFYGQLRVAFNEEGVPQTWVGKVYPVTADYKNDIRLSATLRAFQLPLDAFRKTPVGTAAVKLNGDRADVRKRETNLGNFISDAYLWATQKYNTQIALMNGGGIRASIAAGTVTNGDTITVQPFGNTVYVMDLTGKEVWDALENGVSDWANGAGRFLQVGGMRYSFDPTKAVGSRILSAEVKQPDGTFKPLDLNATYHTVTNSFVAAGGDNFTVLKNAKGFRLDTYLTDYVVVNDYFAFVKSANPQVEGRVTIVNEPK
ncbi:bifunctional metallophosphatase/5'-nucleotidase [Deinococcus roseus]|uniref:Multifunctional 2',3'-cyclic-nucleotide 2'-phosphodiesterase/5'-nucleotidase/3'-nucleotidase n=1 Tax=Deinococcus roseus TaxID=392414 RepID=A0ABQ2D5N1_9DEIO|nr:5'-nucleotidase C-terminal domain-containing protein [Deinococcus roseus]GGJ45998.1 multifunctional 2',3'-cyclic-nucleotide 2'-phosphodiesterase/5'-nucleotidase/3'-nucleotidase [Deinococcus roseus]